MAIRYLKPVTYEQLVTLWDKPVPISLKNKSLYVRVKSNGLMHSHGGGSYVTHEDLTKDDMIFMTLTLTCDMVLKGIFISPKECPIALAYYQRTNILAEVGLFGLTDVVNGIIYEFENGHYNLSEYKYDLSLASQYLNEPNKVIRTIKLKGQTLETAR